MKYNHSQIERKWQKKWGADKIYEAKDNDPKPKFYGLIEFPYPSGEGLHMGHIRSNTAMDIISRKRKMEGYNVLYPIGWDAFGLPTENYAIKTGIAPDVATKQNTDNFRRQLKELGFAFDWSREINTTDPNYYKWTQWLFLQFFNHGLAYKAKTYINWCPKDKIGLANEEAKGGVCDRCGTKVEKREKEQWMLKITAYADKLLDGLKDVDFLPEIKKQQENWIGRSEGAEIDFPLAKMDIAKRIVILHGRNGTPENYVFPWLKQQFEQRGYEVEVPALPNTNEPNDEEQADYVQSHCKIDEKTVIVAQSFGGIVAMRLLERGIKVQRVVLVSVPFSGKFNDGKERKSVTAACKKGFNFEVIKKNSKELVVLWDERDEIVPREDSIMWQKNLDGLLLKGKGEIPHFSGNKEPDIVLASVPTLRVFTTRADTIFGATYVVLAPEHPFVANCLAQIANREEVQRYIASAKNKPEEERAAEGKEKTGVELKGIKAINPATKEEIPIWVADYVMMGYGTGAIMAVPAHDERDFEFARKYKLPICPVIMRQIGTSRSFVMGIDEKEISSFGSKIIEKTPKGFFKIEIPFSKIENYKKFIRDWMKPNFWNEFSTPNGFYFIFKHKDGKLKEFELNAETNDIIDKYGATFNDEKPGTAPGNVFSWLADNEFYKELLIHSEPGVLINSGKFDGLKSQEARAKIAQEFGTPKVQYKLRDWVFSRQRYWGEPIPLVFCPACAKKPKEITNYQLPITKQQRSDFSEGEVLNPGWIAVDEKDLPVKLPKLKNYQPRDDGQSPLASVSKWVNVKCPKCKGAAKRETDTMPNWAGSSWYFYRYCDPHNKKEFAAMEKLRYWMGLSEGQEGRSAPRSSKSEGGVDWYNGGMEHVTLHLLYARFWNRFLYDIGLVPTAEPFKKRTAHGLILAKGGVKMSKSKGNVVNPDELVKEFGADALRLYEMFIGPFDQAVAWDERGIVGTSRFLEKVWEIGTMQVLYPSSAELRYKPLRDFRHPEQSEGSNPNRSFGVPQDDRRADLGLEGKVEDKELIALLHKTIKKVSEDIETMSFNTAISAMMIFINKCDEYRSISSEIIWKPFLKILAPFAPHISEELWQLLRGPTRTDTQTNAEKNLRKSAFVNLRSSALRSVHCEEWPEFDPKLIVEDTFELVIQINGKTRGTVRAAVGISQAVAEKLVRESETGKKWLTGEIKKLIFVKDRLINFIL